MRRQRARVRRATLQYPVNVKREGKDAMQPKQRVIEHIREAFCETERPGDAFLQGSHEGCEPGESVAPFIGVADAICERQPASGSPLR